MVDPRVDNSFSGNILDVEHVVGPPGARLRLVEDGFNRLVVRLVCFDLKKLLLRVAQRRKSTAVHAPGVDADLFDSPTLVSEPGCGRRRPWRAHGNRMPSCTEPGAHIHRFRPSFRHRGKTLERHRTLGPEALP